MRRIIGILIFSIIFKSIFKSNLSQEEPINVEAIACVGMNHFYADQPEVSLRFYRRLLQMGVSNAELYNNLGLCCFYAQQYDMSLACMDRALTMATDVDILGRHHKIE